MATGLISPVAFILQAFSDQGIVGSGYQIATYEAGSTAPVTTYTDSTLTVENANPIVLRSNGRLPASVWAPAGTLIKMVLLDNLGNTIAGGTVDNLPMINDLSSALYPQTTAEQNAGVVPANLLYPPGDVRRYGAEVDGVTIDTVAVTAALAQNNAGGSAVYFPAGTCICQITLSGLTVGLKIRGEGLNRSIIGAINSSADILTTAAGAQIWGLTIEDVKFNQGASSSFAGHGVHFTTGLADPPFNVVIRNVLISGCGSRGIFDEAGIFTSYCDNVMIGGTGYHNFDILGDNTTSLRNCYAFGPVLVNLTFNGGLAIGATSGTLTGTWKYPTAIYPILFPTGEWRGVTLTQGQTTATWVTALLYASNTAATLGAAGYRFHGGAPLLDSCNGLNGGNVWGLFSDNIDEDGGAQFCTPYLLNCNVESFARVGVRNKQCGIGRKTTTFLADAVNTIALQIEPFVTASVTDTDTDGFQSLGAAPSINFTANLNAGATGGTLSTPWAFLGGLWQVPVSNNGIVLMLMTFGSTAVTFPSLGSNSGTQFFAAANAFANTYPCQTDLIAGRPFLSVNSPGGANQFSFYDRANAQVVSMSTRQYQQATAPGLGVTNRYAETIYDANVLGMLSSAYSGLKAFAAATSTVVTFATQLPAGTTYIVLLGGNLAGYCWASAQTTSGFTINCSVSNSNSTPWAIMVT